jgi:hypothetical protein
MESRGKSMKRIFCIVLSSVIFSSVLFSQGFQKTTNGFITVSKGDTTSIEAKWKTKQVTIPNPFTGDNLFGHVWEYGRKFTIKRVLGVLQGSSTPSVTWKLNHGTDRSSGSPAVLVTAGSTTTSITSGDKVSTFTGDATVDPFEFIWFTITAQSGVVDALHLTIWYYMGDSE